MQTFAAFGAGTGPQDPIIMVRYIYQGHERDVGVIMAVCLRFTGLLGWYRRMRLTLGLVCER